MGNTIQSKFDYYYKQHRLTSEQVFDLREYDDNQVFGQAFSSGKRVQQMKIVAEFFRLSQLFLNANLKFVPMKGPILSWRLHKDYTVRRYRDLDLLFDLADIDKVSQVLKSAGYIAQYFELPSTKNKRRLVLKKNHHLVFEHPVKKVYVEIHWKLSTHNTIPSEEIEKIIEGNWESLVVQGHRFKVFSQELEFVYLVIHGAKHGWARLKWLHDIFAFYQKQELDWEKVIELAEIFKCEKLLLQSECLVNHFFKCEERVFSNRISRNIDFDFLFRYTIERIMKKEPVGRKKTAKDLIRWQLYLYKSFPSRIYRIGMLRSLMLREIDMTDLVLPDRLAFLYVLYRPIGVVRRWFYGKN